MEYKTVGKKIKQYREKLKLTQQQLADKVGVTWEMISRYERGRSSPFTQIDTLSKALNTEPAQLLQKDNKSSAGIEIPLFVSSSPKLQFRKNETKYYYNAPRWIYELDDKVFAVETSILKIETLEIANNGVLYLSPSTKPLKDQFIVYRDGSEFVCSKFVNQKSVIGLVIAQEVRFV